MRKREINIGDVFGDWTVIDLNCESRNKARYVKCRCKCGVEKEVILSGLLHNKTTCCKSCARRKSTKIFKKGDKFKFWTIIGGPIYRNSAAYYKVKCECGNEAYKLPVELLYPNRDFCCEQCAHRKAMYDLTINNGRIGDLTKTEYTRLKRSADIRNIPFNVTIEYLWNLFLKQDKKCAITGDSIDTINNASLDRIDSTKGYIESNVQWVTKQANLSKHIMSMDQLYDFCKKVLQHANQQPSQSLTRLKGSETNS